MTFEEKRPEQAIILRPFFFATSSSPILEDSQSEQTLSFSSSSSSFAEIWISFRQLTQLTGFHFTDWNNLCQAAGGGNEVRPNASAGANFPTLLPLRGNLVTQNEAECGGELITRGSEQRVGYR